MNNRLGRFFLLVLAVGAMAAPAVQAQQADETPLTLSADTYYDKTLAGILGQVGGFLSGYEFVTAEALPDEWFRLTYGPYSGDSPFYAVTDYPGYDRLFADGQVGSDDDYHVDFFIQLILERFGPNPGFWNIRQAWRQHQVSDWGGSDAAMKLMNEGMLPPQVGSAEYNRFYWVSEPYIETETVGMAAPGMPETARALTERFASVVGEFDSVEWAELWGTAYALAYFETDARIALEKALVVLPEDSHPYRMARAMIELHATHPDDWRIAQREIQTYSRPVYRIDNPLVVADVNNALAIMAILYGENDFMTTARIASLSGYDADCTAATALGLLGVVQGMQAIPEEILSRVYADGDGVYINDTVTGYPPFIGYDYPEQQLWTELAALYQRNAEAQIVAQGGVVEDGVYRIVPQTLKAPAVVIIPNADFETGTLDGWTTVGAPASAEANTHLASGSNMAQSGRYKGALLTEGESGELFVSLDHLEAGVSYIASAFVQADESARFFVRQGGAETWAGISHSMGLPDREWARRELEFVAQAGEPVEIGLSVPEGVGTRAGIDNLTVRVLTPQTAVRYEAAAMALDGTATLRGSAVVLGERDDAVTLMLEAPAVGEYMLNLYYANEAACAVRLWLAVNENDEAMIAFAPTGAPGANARSRVTVPVMLQAGDNTVRIERRRSGDPIDLSAVELYTKPSLQTK